MPISQIAYTMPIYFNSVCFGQQGHNFLDTKMKNQMKRADRLPQWVKIHKVKDFMIGFYT